MDRSGHSDSDSCEGDSGGGEYRACDCEVGAVTRNSDPNTGIVAQLTLDLPDELSSALAGSGVDLSRAVLEAIAMEAYRERKLSTAQLRQVLGFQTRLEVDGFLKQHGVELEYTMEDLERDREAHRRLGL